jgi:hypothetical protein
MGAASGTTLSPVSRLKLRKTATPLRQLDPKLRQLENQCMTLKRQRDDLTALLRKLRILRQFRSKVRVLHACARYALST